MESSESFVCNTAVICWDKGPDGAVYPEISYFHNLLCINELGMGNSEYFTGRVTEIYTPIRY